jgi:MFS-type transporter involved in bile tolerance (Atg22 family)
MRITTRRLPSPKRPESQHAWHPPIVKRVLESLKTALLTVGGLAGTADFLRSHHSASRILGYAAGIAVLLLVSSSPRLRRDEDGFSFVKSAAGVIVLVTVLLTTMLVVHSWRWILFAALLLAVVLIDLGIGYMADRAELPTDPEPAELRKPSSDVWQNLPRGF